MTFMPFWNEINMMTTNGTSVTKYEGSDYQLLLTVAAALNFTVRVLPSNSWEEVRHHQLAVLTIHFRNIVREV